MAQKNPHYSDPSAAMLAEETFTEDFLEVMAGKVELMDAWDFLAIRNFELNDFGRHSMSNFCYHQGV